MATEKKERTENQRCADMIARFRALAKYARENSQQIVYKASHREFERGRAVGIEQAIEMMERTF